MILGKPNYSVNLIEKDGQHFYTFDNQKTLYPGATGPLGIISKYYLIPWAAKETALYTKKTLEKVRNILGLSAKDLCNDRFIELLYKRSKKQHSIKKEKAADIGTRAHKAIDEIIKGGTPIIDLDTEFVVENFFSWYEQSGMKIVHGDTKVGSLIHGYGGSLDGIIQDETGKLYVLDFKTSNQIDPLGYSCQVAAYSFALKEMFNLSTAPEGIIVRFSKIKPEIEIVKVADIFRSFQDGFIPALTLYKHSQTILVKDRVLIKPEKKRGNKNEANKKAN